MLARAKWPKGEIRREVRLVGGLVAGKARVALDAKDVRLDLEDARKHVDQAPRELVDEQLQRPPTHAHEIVLMRLEPGPILLCLELEQELDGVVGKAFEALERGRRGGHAPAVYDVSSGAHEHVRPGSRRVGRLLWLAQGTPLLQQAGHQVFTPSLTGLGERAHLARPDVNLSTHVQDVANAIWYEDLSDIVLVGHSYGGMVVTGVAERMPERIAHLVYLDAFLPADGQSLIDLSNTAGGDHCPIERLASAPFALRAPGRPRDPVDQRAAPASAARHVRREDRAARTAGEPTVRPDVHPGDGAARSGPDVRSHWPPTCAATRGGRCARSPAATA